MLKDNVLVFDMNRVRKIYAHATMCTKRKISFAQRADIYGRDKIFEPQPDEEDRAPASVWFVKDEGLYLMSPGVPYQPSDIKPAPHRYTCYAQGFDPSNENTTEWYDRMVSVAGGDDFVEAIPVEDFEDAVFDPNVTHACIELHENSYVLGFISKRAA